MMRRFTFSQLELISIKRTQLLEKRWAIMAFHQKSFQNGRIPTDHWNCSHCLHVGRFEQKNCPIFFFPLSPRYYSIASSCLVSPAEIQLIVTLVQYPHNGQNYTGVASGFLCERAKINDTPIPYTVHPSRGFSLPEDPNAAIILIAAGAGIAPFRAFLAHRQALGSPGKSWLFFGERNQKTNFYYRDFIEKLVEEKRLKLNVAFSRDSTSRIYVQHRMWEEREELWRWISRGAIIYVCGDAHHMAKEVDHMISQIVQSEGHFSEDEAQHYLRVMRAKKQYRLDVY